MMSAALAWEYASSNAKGLSIFSQFPISGTEGLTEKHAPAKSSQDKFKFKFKFKSSQSRFSRYGVRPRVPDPAPAPGRPDEREVHMEVHSTLEVRTGNRRTALPRGARGLMARGGSARGRPGGRGRARGDQINLCPVSPCARHVCTTPIQLQLLM